MEDFDMDQRQKTETKKNDTSEENGGNAEYAYFDYGLVAVLVFLICFD